MSQEEYDDGAVEWKDIYQQTKTIQGTQKYHCFILITENKIAEKLFSTNKEMRHHIAYRSAKNTAKR